MCDTLGYHFKNSQNKNFERSQCFILRIDKIKIHGGGGGHKTPGYHSENSRNEKMDFDRFKCVTLEIDKKENTHIYITMQ